MTEQQLSHSLGLLAEPVKNRVKASAQLETEILLLSQIFATVTKQKRHMGAVNPDIWVEFVPWHSNN
jgi:hypothetical protein